MAGENDLIDTRFYYSLDNPFPDDPLGIRKRKLKQYIAANPAAFSEYNYLRDNRYLTLFPQTTELFGDKVEGTDLSKTEFNNTLKQILANTPCASEKLKAWGRVLDVIPTVINGGANGNVAQATAQQGDPVFIPRTALLSLKITPLHKKPTPDIILLPTRNT